MADHDLSDEQVKQLLKDAELRLKNKAKQVQTSTASSLESSLPKIAVENSVQPYIKASDNGPQIEPSRSVTEKDRKLANGIRIEKKATAGADWFNMPRTNLTPELKRDLQLLRMRDVLDPKRHYKKDNRKQQIPEYSQVGTIIEGPTEYFSSRLMNKDRKRTLVEEVLATEKASGRFKSKYNEIQDAKTSGKKAHYRKLRESRKKGVLKR
ncbi:rRNA-processing protein FCF2 [Diplocarpon rosae]|nr:rRNA-processing protein FCF2 [Diplocarpon rosae]